MKKTTQNLIPKNINQTPDYYCTWQTQLYATSDGKPSAQRAIIGEKALFDAQKPYGWAYFYEKARNDLFLVMDDSWDVPLKEDRAYYGSLILNKEKFPEATSGTNQNADALGKLTEKIKALGWKGLGGWVCAQESPLTVGEKTPEDYWSERLREAEQAGFSYWKVDWGKKGTNADFRQMLTALGKTIAPNLIIEHAMTKKIIPLSDVYRTYDVPAIMSIPMTMEKLREFSDTSCAAKDRMGLINCEDEVYIAAAGGFAMGVMRHPYVGALPNGKADMSFPTIHRNLKTKMTEVVRAARFHRIAPAFAATGTQTQVDDKQLHDTWQFVNTEEEIEAWWFQMPLISQYVENGILTKSAPARISRRCPLPEVSADSNGNTPYVVAAKNPNGVFSIATLGRTQGRTYTIPKCQIEMPIGNADTVGVFGEYEALTLKTALTPRAVLMQDLADDMAYDVTDEVHITNGKLIISGALIHKIGTSAQPPEDTSEPGILIKIQY